MTTNLRVVITDFDGTLIDSVGVKDWAFRELYRDHPDHLDAIMNYHLAHNATLRFTKFDTIAKTILNIPFDDKAMAETSARFHDLVFERIVDSPLITGLDGFFEAVDDRMPLYLVSTSPDDELKDILEAIDLWKRFTGVYAGSWKKPDAIRDILARHDLDPDQAVYIGDAPEDQDAARAVGVGFIGRDSGKALDPDLGPIFPDLRGVTDFLFPVSQETSMQSSEVS